MEQARGTQLTNRVDARLDEDVIYDVFYLGSNFQTAQLTPEHPQIEIAGRKFQYTAAGIMCAGQPYTDQITGLSFQRHSEVKQAAATLPNKKFIISAAETSAIKIETAAFITGKPNSEDAGYFLKVFANGARVYFNGKRIDEQRLDYQAGDQLVADGVLLELKTKQLVITKIDHDFVLDPWQLALEELKMDYPLDFPNFRRSPRIRLREPEEQVEIKSPKPKATAGRNSVLAMIVPPLGMVILSVLVSFMSDANPLWMLGMGGASVLTAGFSVSSYFADKKDVKKRNEQREENYRHYLVKEKSSLEKLQQNQRKVLEYMYPSTQRLTQFAEQYDARIYERMMPNDDFLNIRLGTGNITPSFKVLFRPTDEDDPLSKRAAKYLVKPYHELLDAPIVISLIDQTLGLAGNYNVLRSAVQSILWQLAVLHSYRDVEFVTLIPETEYERSWQDWRWLPHMKIKSLNLRGLVHNAQTKEMVLNSFYQILVKRRQRKAEAGNKQIMFKPHYVLTILDETWLSGHQINEFLAEDLSGLGVTVIWGKDSLNMLPETATTTVEYQGVESGILLNRNNVFENQLFVPDHLPHRQKLAAAIERLANLDHVEAAKNTIPDSIDFLKLYGVKNAAELQIEKRWDKADTSKSLAVPLGVRGKNDLVYLNLHERAHGPHGLIAGTTGSGKSEIIQSYILSLAVNYAPEDVGFLPIDFKGGGMANLFKKLPHMLGSITNLDGAGSARALASIRAELQKRKRLFSKYGVNHINGYTKLYKTGKQTTDPVEKQKYPQQPLPHLFLISDEFAELKANEPEFMTELVSTARIGRSLGVHLILATQKPSGVVDDQIWSNSHFKLALKVSDPSDSNEIIKTPDAATITQPGRAYLQVGNNELYELFQSAWSGADYRPDEATKKTVDERIWLLNDYGQQELLTPDLSASENFTVEGTTETQTQLEVVVAAIAASAARTAAALPEKPWLPPLDDEIISPLTKRDWGTRRNLQAPFAFMDLPSRQEKKVFNFDIAELKHTAIYGSSGFGKSTALQTLVMNLSRLNTPEQVQFNLFDFGTNGLLPLAKLPHVADIVRMDQEEKLQKFIKRVRNEVTVRKDSFTKAGVATLKQYEELTGKQLPVIVTVVDGYDTVKDSRLEDAINGMVDQLLREGAGLGLYIIMTALRTSSFKMSMAANIPSQLGLYLVQAGAIRELVGHEALIQQEIIGRAQMKYDEHPREMQIYLPTRGKNDIERLNNLDIEIEEIDKHWKGSRPAAIPMLPQTITMQHFYDNEQVQTMLQELQLPLALDKESTNAVGFEPVKHGYFVLANDTPHPTTG